MKKFYKLVLAFFGTMILTWLGNYFYDSTKNIPVLKYVTGALYWFYQGAISTLNSSIKLWIVFVVLVGLYLMYTWYKHIIKKDKQLPNFINYRKDILRKWIWHWDWELINNRWTITNLTPFCPKDDVQLIHVDGFYDVTYRCPKCMKKYKSYGDMGGENISNVKALILDKINKGTFLKALIHPITIEKTA